MTKLHELAGLTQCGTDADGEPQFIGTRQQWEALENLEMGDGKLAEVAAGHDCAREAGDPQDACAVCDKSEEKPMLF